MHRPGRKQQTCLGIMFYSLSFLRSRYIMTYDHRIFVSYSQGEAYKAALYCCIAWKTAWSFAKRSSMMRKKFCYEKKLV